MAVIFPLLVSAGVWFLLMWYMISHSKTSPLSKKESHNIDYDKQIELFYYYYMEEMGFSYYYTSEELKKIKSYKELKTINNKLKNIYRHAVINN